MKFITPENHVKFKAIPLAADVDNEIKDCAIAFIEPGGGGPYPEHTHVHDHLFCVLSGEIEIKTGDDKQTLNKGESTIVSGNTLHSVKNTGSKTAKVVGISLFKLHE